MPFSNLSLREKDAFFSLLDEYFDSRPGLLKGSATSSDPTPSHLQASAASAVQSAISSNPQAASKFLSNTLKSVSSPPEIRPKPTSTPSGASPADEQEVESAAMSVKSRVAAASQMFNHQVQSSPSPRPPNGLVSSRKMGDVTLGSSKDFLGSLRNSTANKNAPPPAFPTTSSNPVTNKKTFAPPPVRRLTSQDASPSPATEPEGEWAEALYDYNSGEPGDLAISEKQRILIIDRSDADWWRGEVEGRSGVFPASYAKLL